VAEKFTKIQIKYPWQYDSMVFYMNPLCYWNWDEIIRKHDFKQLVLFRLVDYKDQTKNMPARTAVFLKVIDVEKGGRVTWAGLAHGEDPNWPEKARKMKLKPLKPDKEQELREKRIKEEERAVLTSAKLFAKFLTKLQSSTIKESDQILLLNSQRSTPDQEVKKFDELDMAAEDGMVVALVEEGYGVVEKLASIYVNPDEIYQGKVFYINPLFLRRLDKLFEYSGSKITKIIAYKKVEIVEKSTMPGQGTRGPKVAALYVRVIDVGDGNIIYSGIVQEDKGLE
jgi:hypothetical protein